MQIFPLPVFETRDDLLARLRRIERGIIASPKNSLERCVLLDDFGDCLKDIARLDTLVAIDLDALLEVSK